MGDEINIKINIPGKITKKLSKPLTFDVVCQWIRLQGFDEYTTNGLIEIASKYPTQALPSYRRNFNLMVRRVHEKRRKELEGQVPQKEELNEQPNSSKSIGTEATE